MKTKKALAVILALAMIITLMPTMAFASTTNTVSQVYKVAADDDMPVVKLNLKATGNDAVGGIFDLTLNNAEWAVDDDPVAGTIINTDGTLGELASPAAIQVATQAKGATNPTIVSGVTATAVDANSVRIDMGNTTVSADDYVVLYLALKSGTEAGDVTVTVSDVSAKISSGKLTVATIADSKTVAAVVGSTIKKVSSDGTYEGNQIKISETSVNAVADNDANEYQAIRLALPKDYEWVMTGKNATKIGGDLTKYKTLEQYSADCLSGLQAGTADKIYYALNDNKNILTLYFNADNQPYEQMLTITPSFVVGSDAKTGDVAVNITNLKGDIAEASDLIVAENVVESVQVKTFTEITTVQSGLKLKNNSTDPYYVYVQLKENVADALTNGKTVEFDFPEEIQVLDGVKMSISSSASRTSTYENATNVTVKDTTAKDASGFKWTSNVTGNKDTITFKIPVSAEAGFTGDFDITVKGAKAGIDEQTVTVGTVVNPVTIEATSNNVKTGIQNQTVSAVTIKETAKGMLQETVANDTVELVIKGYENSGITLNKANIKAEVTEGDIEISDPEVSGGQIKFKVKSASSKASTIVISGFTVTMNRVAAEGGYDLRVAGNAVVDNYKYNDDDFQKFSVAAANYLNVITPADSDIIDNKIDAQFVIGQASYTNNGTVVTMDAAPYIDSNSRTMVPIRYIANACGISDDNIVWNGATQTATMSGANTVVTIKVGASTITTSTGTITMDTVAVNKDGRIYVPLRFIANAFGADVAWNQATKTASIMK